MRKFLASHGMDDVGMNLAEADGAHLLGMKRAHESLSVFVYVFAGIPIGEAEVQNLSDGFLAPARSFERAGATRNGAETAD